MEPSNVEQRQKSVGRRALAGIAFLPLLVACSPDESAPTSSVSPDDIAKAETLVRDVIADQDARVTSASVIARSGRVLGGNTGHPCTSGRELEIKLIGDFPHISTTGHPVKPGSAPPDFTVEAMVIIADADSGRA